MRIATLVTVLLFAAAPARAAAPTMNLLWDDCALGGGSVNKVSPCNSNIGAPYKLILSIEPGSLIENVNGAQGYVDLVVDAPSLPDFWHLESGGCRSGKLVADAGVGGYNPPFSCIEPWSQVGNVVGASNFSFPAGYGPNHARILWIAAVPGTFSIDPTLWPEWYVIALNLVRAGTTTCAGCDVPAQLTTMELRLTKPYGTPGGDVFIYTGAHLTVSWQAQATPTVNRTWGQVKALFR